MATKTAIGGAMGWIDLWKTIDPSGGMAEIYNETVETNSFLDHTVWMEANQGVTHQVTRVSTLPASSNKRMGVGTAATSGSAENAIEETKVRETWLEIEDEVLQKHPNPEAYIQYQTALAVQGITQDAVQDWLYGNRLVTPDDINGLLVRHNNIEADRKKGRVASATGASNANSSILGVKWGEDGLYMVYPSDHPNAGVDTQAFAMETKRDANGKMMRVLPIRVQFAFGIVEKNRRYVFRLGDIDASISSANWITLVEDKLVDLLNDCPADAMGFRLYGNNFVKTKLDIRVKDKSNVYYVPNDPISQRPGNFTMFNQTPFYKVERMVANESNLGAQQ